MDDQTYDGRRPSIGFGRGGPYVRGFRSKPGAPQHDPTSNVPMSPESKTSQSNWDRIFRNTVSNDFGANGENPLYVGAGGAAQPLPNLTVPDAAGMPSLNSMFNGPSHSEMWSQPRPRTTLGWEAPSSKTTDSIFSRYKTKDTRYVGPDRGAIGTGRGFGWASAFDNV